MSRDTFRKFFALPGHFRTEMRIKIMVTFVGIAFISSMVAACGNVTATAAKSAPAPAATHVITPTPTPEPAQTPTPVPTPRPKSTPVPATPPPPAPAPIQATPTPAPAPAQAPPAVLDLRPSSMSIVGHLDCQRKSAFVCFARVISSPSNQSNLHWTAFTNVPGGVTFSPASGVLAPGQSMLVTITVPFNACTPGLFFFQGPINTHTITWAC